MTHPTADQKLLDQKLLKELGELYKKLSGNQRELPADMKRILYENRRKLQRK